MPDLALANNGLGSVTVFLNLTAPGAQTPSLAPGVNFAVGTQPLSVALGDLNGDGKPDLAVANGNDNTVAVLLNTSSWGRPLAFEARADFTTGSSPTSVQVADINGDGLLDLAIANQGSNTVSVLLNTTAPGAATPSFAAKVDFAAGTTLGFVAIGDLNGDGKPDLVTNSSANTVSVLFNTTAPGATTPSFATKVDFATGTGPASVNIADLNGDGKLDLAVVNNTANTVSVLLNTTSRGATTPTFAAHVDFATGAFPISGAIGDINGDGRPDLAVVNGNDNTASVLFNTTLPGATAPTFATKVDFPTGLFPFSIAMADLNGDGVLDLAVANGNTGTNTASVLFGTTAPGATTPTFAPKVDFAAGGQPEGVAIGDLDGDGRPDLALANASTDVISILRNTTVPGATTPSFAAHFDSALGSQPFKVAIGDFNGDGKLDLVVNGFTNTVSILLAK